MTPRRRTIDDAAISRLVDQRREVVGRAVRVLDSEIEIPVAVEPDNPDALRETVALLTVSLEELKVAEEELVQQNEELVLTREAVESSTRHFHRLFDEVPLPYLVTDVVGMIRHANHAAAALLKRPADLLEGRPLLTFVPLDGRSAFREAINRLHLVDAARDWRVTLLRYGDGPVPVSIDVRLSRGAHAGEDLVCWILRPPAAPAGG